MACNDGNPTFPGGIGELHLINFSSEVGKVYPGVGGARRSNVLVDDCGVLVLDSVRLIQHPKAHPIALEIGANVHRVTFSGVNEIVGQIKYRGAIYKTLDALHAAVPALFI